VPQVEKLFRRYDKDGSGDIDFHEFLKLIMYAEELAPEVSEFLTLTLTLTSTFTSSSSLSCTRRNSPPR